MVSNTGRRDGFSLIELLVAVAIVAIIASIALPGYQSQIQRSKRSDAKAHLVDTAQRLERCYSLYNAYNSGSCNVTDHATEGGEYDIEISNLGTNTYTLTATAKAGQRNDKDCVVLTLDHNGIQGSRNAAGAATTECW